MLNDIDETAFPVLIGRVETDRLGMSLRDYFAAAAMAGLIANPMNKDAIRQSVLAGIAYQLADAMMEARKKYG